MFPAKETVGSILRRLREERHLTQDELGRRSMIGGGYVCRIENGDCNCSLKALFRLAEGLDMRPSEIVREIECSLLVERGVLSVGLSDEENLPLLVDIDPEPRHRTFGVLLRQWRTAAHLTQQEVATRAGLTGAFISNMENGKCLPRQRTCLALARTLGVPDFEVLTAAGRLDNEPDSDVELLDPEERFFFRTTWGELTEDERLLLRDTMRLLASRAVKRRTPEDPQA